jgi:serine/threonine-protein kinase
VGPQRDYVKLHDFVLAKSVGGAEGQDSLASVAGLAIGTPAYMAPEMVTGGGQLDGRTDLYSVGCVAYYLLTGELVFAGETAVQTALLHVSQPPVPPSQRTGNPIPAELERLVLACLAKEPDDRPQSASELNAALAAMNGAAG